ncbi:MAG: histidinol-phosphate transaminase [Firmicutes bacterium]|nr:histidinol-phosphate transaminase [Bacillota bacterium]
MGKRPLELLEAVRPCFWEVAPYEPGKPIEEVAATFGLDDVIKLASNENPFGTSPLVKQTLRQEVDQLHRYPDGAGSALREALAAHWNVTPENVLLGNGTDEILQFLCRAFLVPGTNAVMADPTFSRYEAEVRLCGAEARKVPLRDGVHDLMAMLAAIDERTRIVWVCNPNNPTGTYVSHDALAAFIASVPARCLVVLDEAYVEYADAPDFPDSVALWREHPNLVILHTFSKIYGLAALRIGYALLDEALADLLNREREPFNTNRLAQRAALAALQDQDFVRICKKRTQTGKEQLYEAFDRMQLHYLPSQANFVLVYLPQSDQQVAQRLLRQGVIVRAGEALGVPQALRVTIGSAQENERFINVLQTAIDAPATLQGGR